MISAQEAMAQLRAGNQRFVERVASLDSYLSERRRSELIAGQHPHAVILGCSDARVPIEIIFDQGFGDLFVIRVAGNVVQPSQVGSVEFAAEQFGTRLVVVLGHSHCGAVQASLEQLQRPPEHQSRGLSAIVDRIRPAVQPLLDEHPESRLEDLERRAVRRNVRTSVNDLKQGSETIERLIREDGLLVVGAMYSLETGQVTFLDDSGSD